LVKYLKDALEIQHGQKAKSSPLLAMSGLTRASDNSVNERPPPAVGKSATASHFGVLDCEPPHNLSEK
jgi:hypothetical protein